MYFPTRFPTAFLFALGLAVPAPAQDGSEEIPFAGGTITIVETTDYEKIVSFNGEEIDRDFQVWFERIATVRGTEVALISIGPGGNACGANTLLLWSDGKDGVNTDKLPGDCGWPAPAVSDYAVFFVPWPGPGEELPVQRWAPDEGFALAGMLRFVPEPDTGWAGITADPAIHPLEYFSNAAFFADAAAALGDDLAEYALGLRVAAEMEKIGGDIYAATGCVPHNCGGADSLLVVDIAAETAWFAQKRGTQIAQWPSADKWTPAARNALKRLGTP
jgi:hypothetical protein